MNRNQFISHLRTALQRQPRNVAIKVHLAKVQTMNDDQYAAHRAALDAKMNSVAVQSDVRRMASEVLRRA